MITLSAAQWGNEITLKYAHKEPTAQDLRRMAFLLKRESDHCLTEARAAEDREAEARREEDKRLP
jgi:hypothetical protein